MTSLAVTYDDKYVVSSSADRSIAVWQLTNLKLHYKFNDAHDSTAPDAIFSRPYIDDRLGQRDHLG